MADVRAIASGNYNNPAIWNTGVVPGSTDTVRANGFTITFTADATAGIYSTQAGGGAVNGGLFRTSTKNLIITGDWLHGTGSSFIHGVASLSTIFIGNILNAPTGTNGSGGIQITQNAATCYWYGDITAMGGAQNTYSLYFGSAGGTLYFTGSSTGGAVSNCQGIFITNVGNSVLNGSFYAGVSTGIGISPSAGLCCTGGAGQYVTVNGGAIGTNGSAWGTFGIINSSALNSLVIDYAECSTEGNHPVAGPVKYRNTNPYFKITKANGSQVILVDPATLGAGFVPDEADVRDGVIYEAGNRTGKLKIPPKPMVALGVPTDDGVGTLNITVNSENLAAELLTEIQNSDNPIAERLRNVATVQSTAATIENSL